MEFLRHYTNLKEFIPIYSLYLNSTLFVFFGLFYQRILSN